MYLPNFCGVLSSICELIKSWPMSYFFSLFLPIFIWPKSMLKRPQKFTFSLLKAAVLKP